jgi:hypothetical protein
MMYTVRYAHLDGTPGISTGDILRSGDKIARMGNTGKSTGAHLHIDCVEGAIPRVWRLSEMEEEKVKACPSQLNWFIDKDLFQTEIEVTTYFCDPFYGKIHMAYDVIPKDRSYAHFDIYWNRSVNGRIISYGSDAGYGNFIHILFEVKGV